MLPARLPRSRLSRVWTRSPTPPTSFTVLGPYVRLSWTHATKLYVWMCTGLYVLLVYLLALEVGETWSSPRRLLFACYSLALAPVQTGIHEANMSVMAFLLCGYALLLARRRSDIPAAVLLTLSLFLKPTVGFTLILLFVCTRRWRIVSICAGLGAALATLTVLHMRHIDPAWRADYQHALALVVSKDGPGSFVSQSAAKFDLLNLQVPFYQVAHNAAAANIAAWGVTIALALAWAIQILRKPRGEWSWADAGAIGLVSLLPIYQRNYNAAILIFCLLWAFRHWERRTAKGILALSAVFLAPGVALLRAAINPHLPQAVTSSYLWNTLVMPHTSLVLIPLTCLMLVAMRTPARATRRLPADSPRQREASDLLAS